jgi:Zn-dependent peptidase ImmA (M78 family)
MKDLEYIFGPESTGATTEERAKTSTRKFIRSQDHLSVYCGQGEAKGRVLSAWETLKAYGLNILREALDKYSAIIVADESEPAKTFRHRRELLGLSIEDIAKAAQLDVQSVKDAEDVSTRTPIRILERIGRLLGLDDRLISFERGAGGNDKLGIGLRLIKGERSGFEPEIVLAIGEASWIISTQAQLRKWLCPEARMLWHELRAPSTQIGEKEYSASDHGRYLAQAAREKLNIDSEATIESLYHICENILGIPIVSLRLPKAVAGLSILNEGSVGIVINSCGANENVWVRRFTIAHEIAHILYDSEEYLYRLHIDDYISLDPEIVSKADFVEKRANAFASEFIAPLTAVESEFKRYYKLGLGENGIHLGLRAIMERFGLNFTASKHQAWYALDQEIKFDLLNVADKKPTDYWCKKELLTTGYFKPNFIGAARQGAFALLIVQAEQENLISEDTATEYLCPESSEQYKDYRQIIRNTFLSRWDDPNVLEVVLNSEPDFKSYLANVKYLGTLTLQRLVMEHINEGLKVMPHLKLLRDAYIDFTKQVGTQEISRATNLILDWIDEDPENIDNVLLLLDLLYEKGTVEIIDTSLQRLDQWISDHPQQTYVLQKYLTVASTKASSKGISHAFVKANHWLSLRPDDNSIRPLYLELLRRYMNHIIEETHRWITDHPDDQDMILMYAKLVIDKGGYKQVRKAIETIRGIITRHPENNSLAVMYLSLIKQRGTREDISKVIETSHIWLSGYSESKVHDQLLNLIELYGTPDQTQRFLETYMSWLKERPDISSLTNKVFTFVARHGTQEQFQQFLDIGIEWFFDHPAETPILSKLLFYLLQMGSPQQKEIHVIKVKAWLDAYPQLAEYIQKINYGKLLLDTGKYQEAYAHFTSMLEEDENNVFLLKYQARALTGLEKFGQAEEQIREAVRLVQASESRKVKKQEGPLLHELGYIYLRAKDYAKAKEAFLMAVEKSSENSYGKYLSYWRLGEILIKSEGNYKEAKTLLLMALEKAPPELKSVTRGEIIALIQECEGQD